MIKISNKSRKPLPPFDLAFHSQFILEILQPHTKQDLIELRNLARIINQFLQDIDPETLEDRPHDYSVEDPIYLDFESLDLATQCDANMTREPNNDESVKRLLRKSLMRTRDDVPPSNNTRPENPFKRLSLISRAISD